jgi:hypothetical protein
MKSTNHAQTTEAVNKKAVAEQFPEGVIAPTWQSHIVDDLNDEAAVAIVGGYKGGYHGKYTYQPISIEEWEGTANSLGMG